VISVVELAELGLRQLPDEALAAWERRSVWSRTSLSFTTFPVASSLVS